MRLIFIFISIILSSTLIAQFPSFKLGGLSRALSNTAYLGDEDTSNNDISQDFNIVFDLAINGKGLFLPLSNIILSCIFSFLIKLAKSS